MGNFLLKYKYVYIFYKISIHSEHIFDKLSVHCYTLYINIKNVYEKK